VVDGRALVRILPVAEFADALILEVEERRERLVRRRCLGQIQVDGLVVPARHVERLDGELLPCFERQRQIVLSQQSENPVVLVRPTHDGDVREVLCGGPQQRDPADVDLLERVSERRALFRHCFLERVEVDDDHVDGLDALLLERGDVALLIRQRQDGPVDARVQRLDAAVQDLRGSRQVRYLSARDLRGAQDPRGASR
jgi:hypothetical protein